MVGLRLQDLDEETRQKLDLETAPTIDEVGSKLIVLGRVFRCLKGLSDAEALWVMKKAQLYIEQYAGRQHAELVELVLERPPDYVPPVGWVIQVVAKVFNMLPADLVLRKRDNETALARQVAMYLLWKSDNYTLAEVGKALGGRTPATVSHGFQRVVHLLSRDKTLESKVAEILSLI